MLKRFLTLSIIAFQVSYALELEKITVEEKLPKVSTFIVDEETQIDNKTLSEKLFNSVMINETDSHTNSSVISVRGNSFRATDYYEDGVPLYKSSNGYVDLSIYRANDTTIKINAGGAQGVYASSASGGEIILESKKVKDDFYTSVSTTLSTNEMYANLGLSHKDDSFYWKLDLNGIQRDYYKLSSDFLYTDIQKSRKRVNSDKEQFDGSLKVGYALDDYLDIAFKVSHLRSEYGIPVQVYNEPSNLFNTNADYTRVDDKELTSYWFYYNYKKSDVKLTFRAYYDLYTDVYNFYDSPSFTELKYDTSRYNDSRVGAISSLNYDYDSQHEGVFTIRVDRDIHEQVIEGDPTVKHYEAIESSFSYMHNFQVNSDLLIAASMKYKQQNLRESYQFTSEEIEYKDNEAVDFQLTSEYRADKTQSYYLSLAKKSRFASLTELYPFFPWDTPNTNMKPEESQSVEIGAKVIPIEDTIVNFSLFYNRVDEKIVYENGGYANVEEAVLQGFETKVYNHTFENHEIELSYAYTDAKDKNDVKIVQIPESKLLLQDAVELNSKTHFNLSYLYMSSIDDIYNSTRYSLDGYSLVDMQISYEPSNSLHLKTGVKNLLDENWEYSHGQPAAGRSFFISMKYEY